MKIQKNAITASWGLVVGLVVLIGGLGYGFTYATQMLKQQATATTHARIDNELAEQEISKLRSLSNYLSQNKATVQRASEVVAASQSYTYQNQGIADLNAYASRTGVSIAGIEFPAIPKQQTQTPGMTAIAGVKRIPISIRLAQQVDYVSYMRFIKSIEQNLTKMQITSVVMTPDPKSPTKLTSPTLTVEVFIR